MFWSTHPKRVGTGPVFRTLLVTFCRHQLCVFNIFFYKIEALPHRGRTQIRFWNSLIISSFEITSPVSNIKFESFSETEAFLFYSIIFFFFKFPPPFTTKTKYRCHLRCLGDEWWMQFSCYPIFLLRWLLRAFNGLTEWCMSWVCHTNSCCCSQDFQDKEMLQKHGESNLFIKRQRRRGKTIHRLSEMKS